MSRNKWYWTLQLGGWTLYGIVGFVVNGMFQTPGVWNFLFALLSAGVMLFTTHVLRFLIKKYDWLKPPFLLLVIRLLTISLGFAIIINTFNSFYLVFVTNLFSLEDFSIRIFFLYVFQTTLYYALWLGIYLGVYYFRNYKSEEIEKWKLQSALKDAELIALKAQINPHFLFNALNNIRALILEDQLKARDMVAHLSELLRYSIQFNEREKVTVAEEIEIVTKYLELESIHYEQRLSYSFQVDDRVKEHLIPSMVIQLMVENAVKHGISQLKKGGKVNIQVQEEKENVVIEVCNTGKLLKTENEGIGIRNATERARLLFERDPEFSLYQEGPMVVSRLIIPKI